MKKYLATQTISRAVKTVTLASLVAVLGTSSGHVFAQSKEKTRRTTNTGRVTRIDTSSCHGGGDV